MKNWKKHITKIKDLHEKLNKLKSDATNLGVSLRTTDKKLTDLEREHTQLNTYYRNFYLKTNRSRRTEIIITPDLSEAFKMLENN